MATDMKTRGLGEAGLIRRLSKGLRLDRSVVKGIGDDAAVIRCTGNKYLLYACDILVEDVHFRRKSATPFQIGWKALGRNISDIAAMGGIPRHAVISMALPGRMPVSFAEGVYRGIKALAAKFGINIVGGDISDSEKVIIDISLLGEAEKNRVVARSGAKEGDLILVTGSIGGSGRGRHLDFMPRIEESRELTRRFKISSMIDISDGLLLDLWRILDSSSVGARIYQNAIPLSQTAASFDKAVCEGEDFELLFTMSIAEGRRFFKTALAKMKTPVTLIGEITDKRYGYRLVRDNGKAEKVTPGGYLHFKPRTFNFLK